MRHLYAVCSEISDELWETRMAKKTLCSVGIDVRINKFFLRVAARTPGESVIRLFMPEHGPRQLAAVVCLPVRQVGPMVLPFALQPPPPPFLAAIRFCGAGVNNQHPAVGSGPKTTLHCESVQEENLFCCSPHTKYKKAGPCFNSNEIKENTCRHVFALTRTLLTRIAYRPFLPFLQNDPERHGYPTTTPARLPVFPARRYLTRLSASLISSTKDPTTRAIDSVAAAGIHTLAVGNIGAWPPRQLNFQSCKQAIPKKQLLLLELSSFPPPSQGPLFALVAGEVVGGVRNIQPQVAARHAWIVHAPESQHLQLQVQQCLGCKEMHHLT